MLPVLAAGAMFAGFTAYPAFGDRSILEPALTPPGVTVEAATDRGPVIDTDLNAEGCAGSNPAADRSATYSAVPGASQTAFEK